jgi:hypothetical protein
VLITFNPLYFGQGRFACFHFKAHGADMRIRCFRSSPKKGQMETALIHFPEVDKFRLSNAKLYKK